MIILFQTKFDIKIKGKKFRLESGSVGSALVPPYAKSWIRNHKSFSFKIVVPSVAVGLLLNRMHRIYLLNGSLAGQRLKKLLRENKRCANIYRAKQLKGNIYNTNKLGVNEGGARSVIWTIKDQAQHFGFRCTSWNFTLNGLSST